MTEISSDVQGCFDGYKKGAFEGWAWRPDRPNEPVMVEIYANGLRIGETEASLFRPDVRAAGKGDGRSGFSLPFEIDLERSEAVRINVRVKDGPSLTGDGAMIGGAEPLSEEDAAAFEAFIAAVLGRTGQRDLDVPEPEPRTHFIVYSPAGSEARADNVGGAEYSYIFVLRAFLPLLQRFGEVHVVDDPARQVDDLFKEHLTRGEPSLFLSFAPPHRTVLGLRCPVIPVIAWEYPTIPFDVWEGERRHDWRWVLRQTGRAITLSHLAAHAIRAAMGPDFPVIAAPAPIWDRRPELHGAPQRAIETVAEIEVDGWVFDSRAVEFSIGMTTPAPPAANEAPSRVALGGVVFTSVFAPKDGRKNWQDLVSAFLSAMGARADATLVLKMVGCDPSQWWWEMFDRLSRTPRFACRLIVINGFLDEAGYGELIAASHWVVNASTAEGMCLPLVEFMCAGRPAIAPAHTAMADYFDAGSGLVVHSDEQYCGWPHDTRMGMTTTRHQVSWSALRDAYAEGYRLLKEDPVRHRALGQAAAARMQAFCSDAVVSDLLSGFLGLGRLSEPARHVSDLLMAGATA